VRVVKAPAGTMQTEPRFPALAGEHHVA
jgi:hypothetical protein